MIPVVVASEPGGAKTDALSRLPSLVRGGCAGVWGPSAEGPQRQRAGTGRDRTVPPERVRAPYGNELTRLCIHYASTAGHEGARGKQGSPLPKAKYPVRPIADKYREGKVKSTPGGE